MNTERYILVSGTTRGIGRALAEHFLSAGHHVTGCARGASSIDHARYLHVQADVADARAVHYLFMQLKKRWRQLDVVINNAGTARMLPVALTPAATVKSITDTSFLGTFLVSHEAIRLLRKSEAARIVNMTSIAVPLRLEGEAVYAAAKAAVEIFTRILAKEIGPLGITCNAVGPSPIRTELIRNVPKDKLDDLVVSAVHSTMGRAAGCYQCDRLFPQTRERFDHWTGPVSWRGRLRSRLY